MNQRDRSILEALKIFRVMTRDQVAAIFFTHCRNPSKEANTVLKRMRRDGHITCSTERRMYVYMTNPAPIKKDSSKLNHYLGLCDLYLELRKHDQPKRFTIEPKYGKGRPEPDIFFIWKGAPFWVEYQRNQYTDQVMKAKMKRYEDYYYSEGWHGLDWQPAEKKVFPRIWILTDHRYNIITPFKVLQTRNVDDLLNAKNDRP